MTPPDSFEALVLPHLDAAYNLARWLVRDEHRAQDLVHDACLKALRYFGSFDGGPMRPWLLGIVRNTCYSWLSQQQEHAHIEFTDDMETDTDSPLWVSPPLSPEASLIQKNERASLHAAIEALPPAFREVLILRELEELSYDSIAHVIQAPLGTVMSRLSRARKLLRVSLHDLMPGAPHER